MAKVRHVSAIECPERESLGYILWAMIGLFMACALAAFFRSGFEQADLEWQQIGFVVAVWLTSRASSIYSVQLAADAFAQYVLIAFFATMLTYSAATVGQPLIDRELLIADQFIGYDWRTYASLVAGHPQIARVMMISYGLIFFLPLVVIASVSVTKNVQALEKFILAALISLVLTVGLFVLFPATTAWTYLRVSDTELSAFHYLPLSSEGWIGKLMGIRQGGAANLRHWLGYGLIAFPSFHCIAALLFIWGTWTIRWLRTPMMVVCLALIAATPIFGGHYVMDLVAGAVVMVASVMIAERLYLMLLDLKRGTRMFWRATASLTQGGEAKLRNDRASPQ